MFQLGTLYRDGEGVEQDYAKAIEWFEKAAELEGEISGQAMQEAEACKSLMQE